MNTKHTPGPWKHDAQFDTVSSHHPDHKFSLICKLATGEDRTEEDANAELIAAAPELIHAVELAEAQLRKMGYKCDCENLPTQCPLCACSAAIAKAKGE